MKRNKAGQPPPAELRQRAESRVAELGPSVKQQQTPDVTRLIHELEVHRVELEMQKEELRRAQKEVERSRDLYLDLYDLAPVAYLTLDRSSVIRRANVAAERLLGVDKDAVVEQSLASFLDRDGADQLYLHLRRVFRDREKSTCELRLRDSPILLESVIASSGEGNESLTTLTDLSAIRAAQKRERELESRFELIADHIDEVFSIHDPSSGQVEYASPAFETLWGRALQDIGRDRGSLLQWVHPDDVDRLRQSYERFETERAQRLDLEFRILQPGGECRWVRSHTYRTGEAGGGRYVSVARDITHERALAEELRHAQKMEAVGALASGVAHDFNNVLQAILGCVAVAQQEASPPELVQEYLQRAASVARRGGELANRLVAFARKRQFNPQPISADATVERVAEILEPLVTEQVILKIETHAPKVKILADVAQLEQILMNLAANARDAMQEGGTLLIRTDVVKAREVVIKHPSVREADKYVRLLVRDSGRGMDENTRSRIFEPFFTTKDVGHGTGLGLSTVFAVTQQLGGAIEVDSVPDEGTSFTLYLPIQEGAPPEKIAATRDPGLFSGTVLLVEDHPVIRLTVREFLEEFGFEVLAASDAFDAMRLFRQYSGAIHLLITDVVMPGMRGPKLAAALKERHPDLKVLYISGNPNFPWDLEPMDIPVLEKPFTQDELRDRITQMLSKP